MTLTHLPSVCPQPARYQICYFCKLPRVIYRITSHGTASSFFYRDMSGMEIFSKRTFGLFFVIVIKCSNCQEFVTDAPKPSEIDGATTDFVSGAENSSSLGRTITYCVMMWCTLRFYCNRLKLVT